jgi:hypothetical protein
VQRLLAESLDRKPQIFGLASEAPDQAIAVFEQFLHRYSFVGRPWLASQRPADRL